MESNNTLRVFEICFEGDEEVPRGYVLLGGLPGSSGFKDGRVAVRFNRAARRATPAERLALIKDVAEGTSAASQFGWLRRVAETAAVAEPPPRPLEECQ
jgi:hypothetical protein